MDGVYRFNKERWEALVKANALFSRPWLSETKESALQRLDPSGLFGSLQGKDVLCLAGGGGQQAVAFALNGSRVSVFDISEGQLQRDLDAARQMVFWMRALRCCICRKKPGTRPRQTPFRENGIISRQ